MARRNEIWGVMVSICHVLRKEAITIIDPLKRHPLQNMWSFTSVSICDLRLLKMLTPKCLQRCPSSCMFWNKSPGLEGVPALVVATPKGKHPTCGKHKYNDKTMQNCYNLPNANEMTGRTFSLCCYEQIWLKHKLKPCQAQSLWGRTPYNKSARCTILCNNHPPQICSARVSYKPPQGRGRYSFSATSLLLIADVAGKAKACGPSSTSAQELGRILSSAVLRSEGHWTHLVLQHPKISWLNSS